MTKGAQADSLWAHLETRLFNSQGKCFSSWKSFALRQRHNSLKIADFQCQTLRTKVKKALKQWKANNRRTKVLMRKAAAFAQKHAKKRVLHFLTQRFRQLLHSLDVRADAFRKSQGLRRWQYSLAYDREHFQYMSKLTASANTFRRCAVLERGFKGLFLFRHRQRKLRQALSFR